jgi:hypothetical protein
MPGGIERRIVCVIEVDWATAASILRPAKKTL